MIAGLAKSLLMSILVVGVPVLSHLTARRIELRLIPRIDLYVSAILSQWLLASMAAAVVWLAGPGFRAIGFQRTPASDLAAWAAGLAAVSLAALGLVIVLERLGLWPEESDLVQILLPATRVEKIMAVGVVAPTAAICEELLYRGFLFSQLSQWLDSPPWALVVSAAAFGLAHAYQGWHGMVRTALLGALLTIPVIRLGSLYPSMAAHFLIDAVALAWLGPRFLKQDQRTG